MSDHGFLLKDNIKRVNIVGSAPGWKDAPADNGYIWGVNNVHLLRDVDLVIDVHRNRMNPTMHKDKHHMKALGLKQIPTLAFDTIEGCEHIKKYPLEEIEKEFGGLGTGWDYFGCGIDYMLAYAIYLGAEEVHIYGVWLAQDTEYVRQKPTVEYWIGIARGRGIKVEVHGEHSYILRTPNQMMYGYLMPQTWVKKYNRDQYELMKMGYGQEEFGNEDSDSE